MGMFEWSLDDGAWMASSGFYWFVFVLLWSLFVVFGGKVILGAYLIYLMDESLFIGERPLKV